MVDIAKLEKEWERYKRKKKLTFLVGFILLVTFFTLFWYGYSQFKGNVKTKPQHYGVSPKFKQSQVQSPKHTTVQKSGNVIDNQESYTLHPLKVQSDIELSIKSVKARYKQNKNYDDALYLAKTYYELKQFEEVEFWALEANALDSTSDESWILFAKTKLILGKEGDAIRAIEAYLEKHHSNQLQALLFKMEEALTH